MVKVGVKVVIELNVANNPVIPPVHTGHMSLHGLDEYVPGMPAFESTWDVPPSCLDSAGLAERFARLERERRRLEAELAEVIGEVDRRGEFRTDGHTRVTGWCRALGRWSSAEATSRARIARLHHACPAVAAALAEGTLGVSQCAEMARAFANPRCGEQLLDIIEILLDHAEQLTFDEFRLIVQRWEQIADADGAHRDHERAHRDRRASFGVAGHIAHLVAAGGIAEAAEMMEILRRYAEAEFHTDWASIRDKYGDAATKDHLPRTAAQRSWDALHRIFLDAVSTPSGAQAPEPVLNIVIDLATFEQLVDDFVSDVACTSPTRTHRPADPRWWRCETSDGVPLPRGAVWRAALMGHVRRVVIDAAGVPVDVGRERRLFTGPQREIVLLLDARCAWAGCDQPTHRCQADHTVDHQHGGATATHNGGPACGHHNRWKNRGYELWRDPNGVWHTYRPDGTEIR